jgi:hypothetical protein
MYEQATKRNAELRQILENKNAVDQETLILKLLNFGFDLARNASYYVRFGNKSTMQNFISACLTDTPYNIGIIQAKKLDGSTYDKAVITKEILA